MTINIDKAFISGHEDTDMALKNEKNEKLITPIKFYLVGPFLKDLIGFQLECFPEEEQFERLKLLNESYLKMDGSESLKKAIFEYYQDESYFDIIFKLICKKEKQNEEYLDWVLKHIARSKTFFRCYNGQKYRPSNEIINKLILIYEAQGCQNKILPQIIMEFIEEEKVEELLWWPRNLSQKIDHVQLLFMIKYLDGYREPHSSLPKEAIIENNLKELTKSTDLAHFFLKGIHDYKILLKLGKLLLVYDDVLGVYL